MSPRTRLTRTLLIGLALAAPVSAGDTGTFVLADAKQAFKQKLNDAVGDFKDAYKESCDAVMDPLVLPDEVFADADGNPDLAGTQTDTDKALQADLAEFAQRLRDAIDDEVDKAYAILQEMSATLPPGQGFDSLKSGKCSDLDEFREDIAVALKNAVKAANKFALKQNKRVEQKARASINCRVEVPALDVPPSFEPGDIDGEPVPENDAPQASVSYSRSLEEQGAQAYMDVEAVGSPDTSEIEFIIEGVGSFDGSTIDDGETFVATMIGVPKGGNYVVAIKETKTNGDVEVSIERFSTY